MSKLIEPPSYNDILTSIDNDKNHYHKIIGSSIYGFDDFSVLYIDGKYSSFLKGNYETFSQFINSIPTDILQEKFIVWEGIIYETEECNINSKNFIYDGNLRKISILELNEILFKDTEQMTI